MGPWVAVFGLRMWGGVRVFGRDGGGRPTCQDMSWTGEPPSPRPCSHLLALAYRHTHAKNTHLGPAPSTCHSVTETGNQQGASLHPSHPLSAPPSLLHPYSHPIRLSRGYLYSTFVNFSMSSCSLQWVHINIVPAGLIQINIINILRVLNQPWRPFSLLSKGFHSVFSVVCLERIKGLSVSSNICHPWTDK